MLAMAAECHKKKIHPENSLPGSFCSYWEQLAHETLFFVSAYHSLFWALSSPSVSVDLIFEKLLVCLYI